MVSAIICHHRGTLLYRALETLLESKGIDLEIIVATSLDLKDRIIQEFHVKHPEIKFMKIDGGPARKRNYAAQFAHGEYIAFFDDDVEVEPDCVFEMLKVLNDKSCSMVFGKLRNMEFRERFDEAGSFLTYTGFLWARAESGIDDEGQFDEEEPILAGKSASCMIRRLKFNEINGFDISFEILGEETDLAWRVWLSGGEVYWAPKSVAYHAFNTKFKPKDFYTNERIYFNGCRNYLTMLLKNLGNWNLWIVPFHTLAWCVAAFGMILTGKPKSSWNILRGLAYVYSHLDKIWKLRLQIQQNRVISEYQLFQIVLRQPSVSFYILRMLRYWQTGLHG